MDTLSRPLIALLLGTLALFALWFIALKPSSSSDGAKPSPSYLSAVAAARGVVANSNAAAGFAHRPSAAPSTPAPHHPQAHHSLPSAGLPELSSVAPGDVGHAAATLPQTARKRPAPSSAAVTHVRTAEQRLQAVTAALRAKRTLALLFYNPAGADDRAVRQELSIVPGHRGNVFKLAIPLSEIGRYSAVTNQVTINQSPTLVLIDGQHTATMIVGFSDRVEIAQRVDDALAIR